MGIAEILGPRPAAVSPFALRSLGLTEVSEKDLLRSSGANFEGADLRDADFTGADLRGASFRGARLWYARFDKADVRPLQLGNGSSRAVDLTDALFSRDCFAASVQG